MSVLDKDFQTLFDFTLEYEKFKDANFLITGATGLVGSLLIKSLLTLDDKFNLNLKIFAVVRNLQKAENIFGELCRTKSLTFIKADLGSDNVVVKDDIDYIIHAAAITTSKILVEKPVEAMDIAINGTKKVLELAKKKQVKKMVYVSSMEIYGQINSVGKTSEPELGYVDLSKVRSGYPESKRMCELMCNAYASEYNVNVVSARLAQTFGAGILPGENRVFAQFARSAMNNNDIVLHTEGKSEGNYVYTIDAVLALFVLLLRGIKGEAYNVSNPENHVTIREMAEVVATNFSENSKVVIDVPSDSKKYGYAPDTHLWLDNSKLVKLGWTPQNNLVESYKKMIVWMKEENI